VQKYPAASRRYSAFVCDGPGGVPAKSWRTIRLRYLSGRVVTLVYTNEPADPDELPALMRELQTGARRHGFTIEVVDADGTVTAAPAIRRGGAR
jgi:hypothetical protein